MAAAAFTLKTIAPIVGVTAAKGVEWAGRKIERIMEFAARLRERALDEGVSEPLAASRDLIEGAIPISGDECCEETRRLIEGLIFNVAKTSNSAGRAAALHAVGVIGGLSAEGAVIFGRLAAYDDAVIAEGWIAYDVIAGGGLPWFLTSAALKSLAAKELLAAEEWRNENPNPDNISDDYYIMDAVSLTPRGQWLRFWITANPTTAP